MANTLVHNGCFLNGALYLELSSRYEEALALYQEMLDSMGEEDEKSEAFHPFLAGKYRVMARQALHVNDIDSFFNCMEKAWNMHDRRQTHEFENLLWIKGLICQELGKEEEAHTVFESLAFGGVSPFYASFGLHELGLFDEAYRVLKDLLPQSTDVMSLAQGSRCLMSLRDVSSAARKVYHRLQLVFDSESQKLSTWEDKFVKHVTNKLTTFLLAHPKNYDD
eukprot:TRINITY_DN29619_c0_g2_i1.p1 TRINITY_DN29619_c0_g2~~TRINITY_DN29619_c0_g2_i1.p1  ORF type:complete len:239 (-),score=48.77 TRINITY_DN29619_c0_g2_i1:63-728(-)